MYVQMCIINKLVSVCLLLVKLVLTTGHRVQKNPSLCRKHNKTIPEDVAENLPMYTIKDPIYTILIHAMTDAIQFLAPLCPGGSWLPIYEIP